MIKRYCDSCNAEVDSSDQLFNLNLEDEYGKKDPMAPNEGPFVENVCLSCAKSIRRNHFSKKEAS